MRFFGIIPLRLCAFAIECIRQTENQFKQNPSFKHIVNVQHDNALKYVISCHINKIYIYIMNVNVFCYV